MRLFNSVITLIIFFLTFAAALFMSLHALEIFYQYGSVPAFVRVGCGVLAFTIGLRVAVWSASTYATIVDIFLGKGGARNE